MLEYAGESAPEKKTNDELAYLRIEKEYVNALLVEQPNGHFGDTIMRQFLFDAYRKPLLEQLLDSTDKRLAGIAEKALKETKYHLRHSSEWIIRLGDGTQESHQRIQNSLEALLRYAYELFFENEVDELLIAQGIIPAANSIFPIWEKTLHDVFEEATLLLPKNKWKFQGGREGRHSEHMGYLLAEMQYMQRTYPNMEW